MYTPPVTPWESVTPEVSDPTPSKHEPRGYGTKFHNIRIKIGYGEEELCSITSVKRIRHEVVEHIMLSRGRELPKAGPITGVKS